MRRTIMLSAMCLLLSATEVAAVCSLNGDWKLSALLLSAGAGDSVISVSNLTVVSSPSSVGDFSPGDDLRDRVFSPAGVPCSFEITGISGCVYRGQLNGDFGAGNVYNCISGDRGTFDLIRLTTP